MFTFVLTWKCSRRHCWNFEMKSHWTKWIEVDLKTFQFPLLLFFALRNRFRKNAHVYNVTPIFHLLRNVTLNLAPNIMKSIPKKMKRSCSCQNGIDRYISTLAHLRLLNLKTESTCCGLLHLFILTHVKCRFEDVDI